jgi:hypothetical protein
MLVEVKVMVNVKFQDEDLGDPAKGDPLEQRIVDSVSEALEEALERQEAEGYNHDMEDELSLAVIRVTAARK